MALTAQKKRRTARNAALRPAPAMPAWLERLVPDRSVLAPVLIAAAALLLVLAVVEAWKTPFPWRLGDRPDHGITAKVRFQRLNRFETERAKSDAAEQVKPIFVHDPDLLRNLSTNLRGSLSDVAKAKTLADLRPETRAAFGLVRPESVPPDSPMPDRVGQEFSTLQVAVAKEDETSGDRIDELIAEFERFIRPLERYGRADPNEFSKQQVPTDSTIAIVLASERDRRAEVLPQDVLLDEALKETGVLGKQWERFSELKLARPMLERWLKSQTPVTLRYSDSATKEAQRQAREDAPVAYTTYNQGQLLAKPGQEIDDELLAVLRAEYDQLERQVTARERAARVVIVFLMLLVVAVVMGYFLVRTEPQLVRSAGRLSLYLGALVLAVVLGRLFSFDPWRAEVIPLAALVMVFAIAFNQQLAIMTALVLTLIVTLSTRADLGQFVVLMSVAAAAAIPLADVSSRSSVIKVGFLAAAVFLVVSWGMGVIERQSFAEAWSDWSLLREGLRGAGWCLVAGYLVAGSLPFVESTFGVVTDISLLEMTDVSHPLLQELVRRAPGTYNHSMTVASIGETAADAIGANGLLVRVGAYFHDVGKMLKPDYFVENMTEGAQSRHEKLAPAMSTLIIIGHVKDGVDLARQHNLPPRLIDFVEQHHGTTLVEYFYHEAARLADLQPDHKTDAEESAFRYPGPKPQTRETAVLMLADAVESASRTLSEPTPKRIETLVKQITMKRLLDDQFDECSLTLSDIRVVEESLTKSLIGIYHGRIKYPQQRTA